jgi:membrane protease YdiL (CAAX protease family)
MSRYTSEHTKIGWYSGLIAVLFLVGIGLTYIFSPDDRMFAILTILEGVFALSGLLLLDKIYGKKLEFPPDNFKSISPDFMKALLLALFGLLVAQIFIGLPLTVRTFDKAISYMFSGVSEELFFRGVLLTPAIILGKNEKKYGIKQLEFSFSELIGLLLSSIFFAGMHFNYYDNPQVMVGLFMGGMALGIVYIKYKSLLANIAAHFILNSIVAWNLFGKVMFAINYII